jgi:hypothetical protein
MGNIVLNDAELAAVSGGVQEYAREETQRPLLATERGAADQASVLPIVHPTPTATS